MGVNLKKILLYQIIFFISAFKLKELIDSNNPKFFYFNFLLLFLHLIFASLSILGNKYYKILTIAFHLLASIANNLPFSKIEKIDFEFFKKHFYEIAIVVNVFILVDLKENFKKKEKLEDNFEYIPLQDFPKSNKNEIFLSTEKNSNNNLSIEKQAESKQLNQVNFEIETYNNLLMKKEEKIQELKNGL